MDLQGMVVKTLVANDNARARSQQVAIGPSAIGGCQRRLWLTLHKLNLQMWAISWAQF